jgi:hypothetical protein
MEPSSRIPSGPAVNEKGRINRPDTRLHPTSRQHQIATCNAGAIHTGHYADHKVTLLNGGCAHRRPVKRVSGAEVAGIVAGFQRFVAKQQVGVTCSSIGVGTTPKKPSDTRTYRAREGGRIVPLSQGVRDSCCIAKYRPETLLASDSRAIYLGFLCRAKTLPPVAVAVFGCICSRSSCCNRTSRGAAGKCPYHSSEWALLPLGSGSTR